MDEKKEQAKVRERILRVFKARAQSPGGGPAIIVNNDRHQSRKKCTESHITSAEFPKYKLPDSDDDFLLSDIASPADERMEKGTSRRKKQQSKEESPELHSKQDGHTKNHGHGHSTSHAKSHHREKRRKSRAERNKERAQKQQQVNPHEREEFRKHVKKARQITKQSSRHNNSLHSDDPLFVAITQNRLTRQAGIYNQGKKSHRLYRDPLRVSERVSAAVEEDVKMIVDPSGSPSLHTSMESLPPPVVTSTPIIEDRRTRKRESESEAAKRSHCRSASGQSSGGRSGQVLEMQDLSVQLARSLDLKQLFPGRDHAGEIKCELQKIMKSNSAGKDEVISSESVRKYMESAPHQNSETKSSKPPAVIKPTPGTRSKTPAMSHGTIPSDGAPASIHHATACVQVGSNKYNIASTAGAHEDTQHHSQDQVMLHDVPKATTASNPLPRHIDQSHQDNSLRPSSFTDNALEFLHFAETVAAECAQQQRMQQRETVLNSSCMQPLSQIPRQMRNESYTTDYNTSSHNIEDIYRTSHSSRFGSVRAENLSSLGSDRCKVEWQPDMYPDASMSLRQRSDEDVHTRHPMYEGSSTDILDHIENMEVAGPSPSLPDLYNEHSYTRSSVVRHNQRHRTTRHYHPHMLSQFEKCESESESSPMWRPTFCVSLSPIRKPQLESPSPPELYPQKMF
ncbi:uncharacterized protein [Amphiura filiformis]|uniref:uncharacterized protein n=1 Tax=Amphiura filiformis TaxID=82378 RepID=UPI003B20CC18